MSVKPQNGIPAREQFKYNVVKSDGILKEVVHLEKLTRKQWEKKWGFLRNVMQMYYDDIQAEGIELKKEQFQSCLVSKTEMTVPPSPPVPITSSGFVGWRSSVKVCSLERVGPFYVSPKLTLEPADYRTDKIMNIFIG